MGLCVQVWWMEYKVIDYEKYFKWITKRLDTGFIYYMNSELDKGYIVVRLMTRFKLDREIAWMVVEEYEKTHSIN